MLKNCILILLLSLSSIATLFAQKNMDFEKNVQKRDSLTQLNAIDSVYNLFVDQSFPDSVLDSTWLISFDSNKKISLREMLNKYHNKMIYLDFWASWCGGCRKDIAESQSAKQFLYKHDVEYVYISLDKEKDDWKKASTQDSICKNQYYLLDAKKSPMVKYINISLIPRYLILDVKHNIVNTNAIRPNSDNFKETFETYLE